MVLGLTFGTSAAEEFSAESLFGEEIPRVFGASRFDQLSSEAPASVTVVTREEIDAYGWRTLAEVLRSVRGFYTTYDRSYSYIGTRGFGRPGDFNTRFMLVIDGLAANENIFDGAYAGDESVVAMSSVERIEIIRGPASSLYGTNALFGVISITTTGGRALAGGLVSTAAENEGAYDFSLAAGQRFANGVEASIQGTLRRRDGASLYFPEFDSPLTNHGVAVDADGSERENVLGKIAWQDFTLEGLFQSRHKTVPTAYYETKFNDPLASTDDVQAILALKFMHTLDDRSSINALVSYNYYDFDGRYPYATGIESDWGYGRWVKGEAQYTLGLGSRQRLLVGADHRHHLRQDQGYAQLDPYELYFEHNTDGYSSAVYAQDEIRVGKRVILNLGARYDHYSSFGSTLNPRMACIVALGSATTAKLLYGSAFRAPSAFERFYADGVTNKANPGLEPENIRTYEALFERTTRRFKSTFSVYQYDLVDLITQTEDPSDSLIVFRNAAEVQGQGAEVEIELQMATVSTRASYAIQRSRDESTGATLSNSPRHLARLNLTAPLLDSRLRASAELSATSSRLAVDGMTSVPGHVLTNVALRTGPAIGRIHAGIALYNLFGVNYGDPAGEELEQLQIRQDGRVLRVDLGYEF